MPTFKALFLILAVFVPGHAQTQNPPLATEPLLSADSGVRLREIAEILYPPIEPYQTGCLNVTALHTLYYEISGNPFGIPVVFMHGGPGGRSNPSDRRFFDPLQYKIILMDQRGCGKSLPSGEAQENNTQALVDDYETLRRTLAIDKWVVFGGSWGSTLGLAYDRKYPNRVLGKILRGIFLARASDSDWLYGAHGVASKFFPDRFERFAKAISPLPNERFVDAYHRQMREGTDTSRMRVAAAWDEWAARGPSNLLAEFSESKPTADILRQALLQTHYAKYDFFLANEPLLASEYSVTPTFVVHGAYDLICPIQAAHELCAKIRCDELIRVAVAGHSAYEIGNAEQLVRATDKMAQMLRQRY